MLIADGEHFLPFEESGAIDYDAFSVRVPEAASPSEGQARAPENSRGESCRRGPARAGRAVCLRARGGVCETVLPG